MYARIFTYSFLLFVFLACKKENALDCFKSNGKEITEVRSPGSFTKIELNDKIELNISYGPEFKVEVIAGKHVIKNIRTEVADGILKIEDLNKCNFVRGYKRIHKVNVTMPYLSSVLNNSVTKIEIREGFEQDSVRVRAESSGDIHLAGTYGFIKAHSNGNGDVYLKGKCKSLNVYINGTNFLRAEELSISDYVFIQTLTKGDCFFNTANLARFEYIIYSEGNIYYKGQPLEITGFQEKGAKGKMIRED